MKNVRIAFVLAGVLLSFAAWCKPQENWPKIINSNDGSIIKIYQPEPESFSDNILKTRSAISIQSSDKAEPVFGTFWTVAKVETDRDNRRIIIQSVSVPNIKLAGQKENDKKTASLKVLLENQLPQVSGDLALDEILSQLDLNQEQKKLSKNLNTTVPKIIYASRPSILVVIDGSPKLQPNDEWGLDVVVNTPFTIVKNNDNKFYLYGGKHWYSADAATGPYNPVNTIPGNLQKVEQAVNEANSANVGYEDASAATQDNTISNIIVSTQPAELIQTDGPANFTRIDSTNLTYASNSGNDIFMDVNTRQYYVLISGRWYTSPSLLNHWKYISADKLPEDFANIPEGSAKDNVLASVAGTEAAREAVMDAQIPQTAKVDRNTATTNVTYNGDPHFQSIQGTDMQYAINTSSSVVLIRGIYYAVDNGVWFQSTGGPNGPWIVCTERPSDVDLIPPRCPLYNIKYVYIYDVTPGYVYMGYTPGYLNTFIYGPTVVYGTGFYYDPWFDGYYYTRPWTWGFNMCYNPWVGWSIGYGYRFGWFHFGITVGRPGYWAGGWWGPHVYRPPYVWNRNRQYGYYGNNYYRNRNIRVNNNYVTNIYVNRPGVTIRNNRSFINNNRPGNRRPVFDNNNNPNRLPPNSVSSRPNFNQNRSPQRDQSQPDIIRQNPGAPVNPAPALPQTQRTPNNNVFSDRNGNVFQRNPNNNNQWEQRQSNQWRSVPNNSNPTVRELNRGQQMRERGEMRTQNFEQSRINNNPIPPMRTFSRPPASNGNNPSPAPAGNMNRPERRERNEQGRGGRH